MKYDVYVTDQTEFLESLYKLMEEPDIDRGQYISRVLQLLRESDKEETDY